MREIIVPAVKDCATLPELQEVLLKVFAQVKSGNPDASLGYVAGMVTSDGFEYIEANIARLDSYTQRLRVMHGFPIFSAADVVADHIIAQERAGAIKKQQFLEFWRAVLAGGVTDVFMTPRWEESIGATDEHKTAKRLGLTIHYVQD